MIKAAIDKILDLAGIQKVLIDGRTYSKDGLVQVTPPEFEPPQTMTFSTLTGLVDYIKGLKEITPEEFLHVYSYDQVGVRGPLQPDNSNKRFLFATSVLISNPFIFGNWYDLESFIIALQSRFVQTETVEKLIQHLGHLANETVVESTDDGFSQSYQIKTGITTKASVTIENPMEFQPYRTFVEIEQPASKHIFRLREKNGMQCTIIEADGDQWKLEAIQSIKAWLGEKLPEMVIIA